MPADARITNQIEKLEVELHALHRDEARAVQHSCNEAQRVEAIRVELDRLWDLLRQPNCVMQAKLTTVAAFPERYFLENLAARADGSLVVTASTQKELWYVPPVEDTSAAPILVHTFEHIVMGIAEAEPDVFFVSLSDRGPRRQCYVMCLDLNGWMPGAAVRPEILGNLNDRARLLNGSCFVAPSVLLLADSFAGLIWRVDLPANGGEFHSSVWLEHASMASHVPNAVNPAPPGVNGIRFASRSNAVYYTSTAQKLLLRVYVDPVTHSAVGEPKVVSGGTMADDICIDEDAGVAYVATHRQNTIDRVPLDPGKTGEKRQIVAGDPFDEQLVGPSAGVWGRQPGDYGCRAYFTTDGGAVAAPPDGRVRNAKVVQVEFVLAPTRRPSSPRPAPVTSARSTMA
jgi:Protein of unknown function (DUF2630)